MLAFFMILSANLIEAVENMGFHPQFLIALFLEFQSFMPMVINGLVSLFTTLANVRDLACLMVKVVKDFGVQSNL